MKKLFLSILFLSLSTQAQDEGNSFFYVTFSSCKDNFYNFSKSQELETSKSDKNNLVCSEKNRVTICTIIDSKGKKIREEKVTKSLSGPMITQYKGDGSMVITVLKSTGGVFYTLTSPEIDSITQTVCVGEVKDASDLKNIQDSKEIFKPASSKEKSKKEIVPIDDSLTAPVLIGE